MLKLEGATIKQVKDKKNKMLKHFLNVIQDRKKPFVADKTQGVRTHTETSASLSFVVVYIAGKRSIQGFSEETKIYMPLIFLGKKLCISLLKDSLLCHLHASWEES